MSFEQITVDSATGNSDLSNKNGEQKENSEKNKEFKAIEDLEKIEKKIDAISDEVTRDNYSEKVAALKDVSKDYKDILKEFEDIFLSDDVYKNVLLEQKNKINEKIRECTAFRKDYLENKRKEEEKVKVVIDTESKESSEETKSNNSEEESENSFLRGAKVSIYDNENGRRVEDNYLEYVKKEEKEAKEKEQEKRNTEKKSEYDEEVLERDYKHVEYGNEKKEKKLKRIKNMSDLKEERELIREILDVHIENYGQVFEIATHEEKEEYKKKGNEIKEKLQKIDEKIDELKNAENNLSRIREELAKKEILVESFSNKIGSFFGTEASGQIIKELEIVKNEYLEARKRYTDIMITLNEEKGNIDSNIATELLKEVKTKEFSKLDFEKSKIKFHDKKQKFGKFMSGKASVSFSLGLGKMLDTLQKKKKDVVELKRNFEILNAGQKIKENLEDNKINSDALKKAIFEESNVEEEFEQKDKDYTSMESNDDVIIKEETGNVKQEVLDNSSDVFEDKFQKDIELNDSIEHETENNELLDNIKYSNESVWKRIKKKYFGGKDELNKESLLMYSEGVLYEEDAEYDFSKVWDSIKKNWKIFIGEQENDGLLVDKENTEKRDESRKIDALEDAFEAKRFFKRLLDVNLGYHTRIALEDEYVNDIENGKVYGLPEDKVKKFQEIKLVIGEILHEASNPVGDETLEDYSERVIDEIYEKCVEKKDFDNDTAEFDNFVKLFVSGDI